MPSRTTKKQVKQLRKGAQGLWKDQQDLLDRAGDVLQQAAGHARDYATNEFVPAARHTYERRVAPRVAATGKAGQFVGGAARDSVVGTVVPAFTSAAAAAVALAEEAADRLSGGSAEFSKNAGKAAKQLGKTTRSGQRQAAVGRTKLKATGKAAKIAARSKGIKLPQQQRGGIGVGGVVGIAIGVIAISGIAYAVWQTLRADDDLWVADDEADTTPTEGTPSV